MNAIANATNIRLIIIVILSLLFLASCQAQDPKQQIIGKWRAEIGPETIMFTNDSTFTISDSFYKKEGKYCFISKEQIQITIKGSSVVFAWSFLDGNLILVGPDSEKVVYYAYPSSTKPKEDIIGKWKGASPQVWEFTNTGVVSISDSLSSIQAVYKIIDNEKMQIIVNDNTIEFILAVSSESMILSRQGSEDEILKKVH